MDINADVCFSLYDLIGNFGAIYFFSWWGKVFTYIAERLGFKAHADETLLIETVIYYLLRAFFLGYSYSWQTQLIQFLRNMSVRKVSLSPLLFDIFCILCLKQINPLITTPPQHHQRPLI